MFRLKVGLVLAGLLAIMAASAAPAFALFEAESQAKLSGQVKTAAITKGGEFVYTSGTGEVVKCEPKGVGIEWKLASVKSPAQQYQIKWGPFCTLKVGANTLPAEVSESELLVESPASGSDTYKELAGTALNNTELKIEKELCVIKVPAASNKGLKGTTQTSPSLTSFEESVLVETKGVTAEEKSKGVGCSLASKSTTGELTGVEFNLSGQGPHQGQR